MHHREEAKGMRWGPGFMPQGEFTNQLLSCREAWPGSHAQVTVHVHANEWRTLIYQIKLEIIARSLKRDPRWKLKKRLVCTGFLEFLSLRLFETVCYSSCYMSLRWECLRSLAQKGMVRFTRQSICSRAEEAKAVQCGWMLKLRASFCCTNSPGRTSFYG